MSDRHVVEVVATGEDARAKQLLRRLPQLDQLSGKVVDVYTIKKSLQPNQLQQIADMLSNSVTQRVNWSTGVREQPSQFDAALEIGFLPGVTDNVGRTAQESIEDLLGSSFADGEAVYTSSILLIEGAEAEVAARSLADQVANPLIQRVNVYTPQTWQKDIFIPEVQLKESEAIIRVDLDVKDDDLAEIGTYGVMDPQGFRRGPLALGLEAMRAIKDYFKQQGRQPTDLELESLAQTWSEHCKHTIFADPLDDIERGIYRQHIRAATEKVRQLKGEKDNCVSVFTDNAGAIRFGDDHLVTHKVETHNSPSALDPFGGAITGIVGVNRDTIGFGLGAKPIINTYGYCFADPNDQTPLFRDADGKVETLSPRRIMEGVIEGVNVGGNCSGIPTPQGFMYFDERYKGKPLVFVGTVGLIPANIDHKPAHEKQAAAGDLIVMVGGRVGLDGIHGATFSSIEMDAHSPATAVQIGDPITQKKLSDALVKEARDRQLFRSITDNGAGGLSCSVAEMAKESGGFEVDIEKVPLKYHNLSPWEIWISESQERMTLAIPEEKWSEFSALMRSRGVEATVIGRFTDSGRCVVRYEGELAMDMEMEFLHDGLPKFNRTTASVPKPASKTPVLSVSDWSQTLLNMVKRLNLASNEFISRQYDHEVQASSVLKPLQGRGRVNAETSVSRPLLDSNRGVVLSQAVYPSYGDLDPYIMAAAAIDTAYRNLVAAGADPDTISLLDNFCWCSSNDPLRLGQLKQATQACYDYAVAYQAPFISGKDSMFNDFKGFDADGNKVQISVPPTILISSIGTMEDAQKAVSIDFKAAGDIVYLLGETKDELGGSEFLQQQGLGVEYGHPPVVEAERNLKLYRKLAQSIDEELIASSISLTRGGLAIALAKSAMAGKLGLKIDVAAIAQQSGGVASALYSESQGRVLVSVAPEHCRQFELLFKGLACYRLGQIAADRLMISSGDQSAVDVDVEELLHSYRLTFGAY